MKKTKLPSKIKAAANREKAKLVKILNNVAKGKAPRSNSFPDSFADAADFISVYNLILKNKISDARYLLEGLDTLPRDEFSDVLYDFLFDEDEEYLDD